MVKEEIARGTTMPITGLEGAHDIQHLQPAQTSKVQTRRTYKPWFVAPNEVTDEMVASFVMDFQGLFATNEIMAAEAAKLQAQQITERTE